MRKWIGLLGAGVMAWTVGAPGAANADLATPQEAAGPTDTGYYAYAVRLEGDFSPSLAGRVTLPPPRCWWTEVEAPDPHNAEQVKEWFFQYLADHGPSSAGGGAYVMASARYPQAFDAAIEQDGDPGVTWYQLQTAGYMSPEEQVSSGCTEWAVRGGPAVGDVPIAFNFFPFQQPRQPVVDPRFLAEYAYEVMDLVRPDLDWNPKISAREDAALINLPTWMWVRDSDSVDTRSVTASVGDVSVTVTAQPGTVRVTSDAGSTSCSTDAATTSYRPASPESSACTISFSKESYGLRNGFPVTATVPWTAAWAGSGESDTLPPRTVSETTDIPVSGSQALVTQVD